MTVVRWLIIFLSFAAGLGTVVLIISLLPMNASALAVILAFFLGIVGGVLFYVLINKLPFLRAAYAREKERYAEAMAHWERSYCCSRCGQVFVWPRTTNRLA